MISLKEYLVKSWTDGTNIDKNTVILAVLIGSGAHFSFYFIFKYYFGLYENFAVRALGVFVASFLGFFYIKKDSVREIYLDIYWHITLIIILPLIFTFNLLATNFNELWLYWEIFMIFVLILYVPNWLVFLVDLLIGIALGVLSYLVVFRNFYALDFSSFNIIFYTIVVIFSSITGLIFSYATREASLRIQRKQYKQLISLSGSIAHELRNPISAIKLSSETLPQINYSEKNDAIEINSDDVKSINDHRKIISKTVKLANEIIDMTLLQLSGKNISADDFEYYNAASLINDSVEIYGYKNKKEREKVHSDIKYDFILKAIDTPFKYVLFNLIKNALYYLNQYPNSVVTIGTNKKTLDSQKYNVIYVEDNGPGIPEDIISKLFGSFITSGKKEGTGLGLAFCKRTMVNFGGDIECESEVGKYTRFNLYFPILDEEELKNAKEILDKAKTNQATISNEIVVNNKSGNEKSFSIPKKILLVDDEMMNIKITSRFIRNHIPNVVIDIASDGMDALELFKKNTKDKIDLNIKDFEDITNDDQKISKKLEGYKHDLIITDIQMPKMDGFELSKKIRKLDKDIPIAAYTSRTSFNVKQQAIDLGIDDYVLKPIPSNQFIKLIHKWVINNHRYSYNIEQIKGSFKNLKVLIVDDEKINHMTLGRVLKRYDMTIETADGGIELVEKYKAQFPKTTLQEYEVEENSYYQNPKFTNQYDVIITDINMPDLSGTDAAKQIRDFELTYNIKNKAIIISNSGDITEELKLKYLKSGIDDYFTKGGSHEDLLKIIYYWQNYDKNPDEPQFLNINKKTFKSIKVENTDLFKSRLIKEDIIEFRVEFIESTNRLLKKIKQDQKNKDAKSLAFNSHALKGISGNLGAEKLFLYVSIINNHAKNNKFPEDENWFVKLKNITTETEKYLNEIKVS